MKKRVLHLFINIKLIEFCADWLLLTILPNLANLPTEKSDE